MLYKNFNLLKSIFLLLMLVSNLTHAHNTIGFKAILVYPDGDYYIVTGLTLEECEDNLLRTIMEDSSHTNDPICEENFHLHETIPTDPPKNNSNFPWPFPWPEPDCTSCPPFSLDLDDRIMERLEQVVNPAQLDRVRELNDKYNINSYNKEIFDLQQQYDLEEYAKEIQDLQQNIDQNSFKNKKLK